MTADQLAQLAPCPAVNHHHGSCCSNHLKSLGFVEDYLFIHGDQISIAQAAARLGVSTRTICRYRKFLRSLEAS